MAHETEQTELGFSLIELLMVLFLLAIIVAVGGIQYKSYLANYYQKIARADLLALAAEMELLMLRQGNYLGAAGSTVNRMNTGSPAIFPDYSPSTSGRENKVYGLTISEVSSNGTYYKIEAKPISEKTLPLVTISYDSLGDWDISDG